MKMITETTLNDCCFSDVAVVFQCCCSRVSVLPHHWNTTATPLKTPM